MRIEVRHLTKVYRGDIRALEDLSLTISGGMFGLLGPNGAGKNDLHAHSGGRSFPFQWFNSCRQL